MSGGGSGNFLLVPIPEYPLLDCVPNKTVKIVVLGASSVGKTALIVRFLTKRFIGDYEANTGALYSRKVTLDVEEVSLQIQDTPCVSLQEDEGLYCQEQINRSIYWADGYVLVFSITDHSSYRTIQPLYQHVRRIHPSGNIPVILVGNKSDLLRARQVPAEEGETLAASLGLIYNFAGSGTSPAWASSTKTHCKNSIVCGQHGVRRSLLRDLGARKPRQRPQRLSPSLPGGDPNFWNRKRGEATRRSALGPTQVPEHAGAEEEVQTSAVVQSQIRDYTLTK